MGKHLSETEFATLVDEIAMGVSSISISRSISRQFFTRVRAREVRELRGLSIIRQKFILYALLMVSMALMPGCLSLVIINFGWTAVVAVPLIGIFWTVLAGFTTETGSLLSSTLIYVAVLSVAPWSGEDYLIPMILFASSLYLFRITHIIAEQFLSRLVMGSFAAYKMLADHILITRGDT